MHTTRECLHWPYNGREFGVGNARPTSPFLDSSIWLLVSLAVFLYLLAALLLFATHTDLPTLNGRSSFYQGS